MFDFDVVEDLERRAATAGVSVSALCREAGVARSTFTRWKSRQAEPTIRVLRLLDEALERLQPGKVIVP